MEAFPKELLNLTEKYTDEPGVLPLFYAQKDIYEDIPKDLQETVSSYISPTDYADLAIKTKLDLPAGINPLKYEAVRMPWSNEKIALAQAQEYYPILRQAYLEDRVSSLDAKIYISHSAMRLKDFPLLLVMGQKDPNLVIDILTPLLEKLVTSITTHSTNLFLRGKKMDTKTKDDLIMNIAQDNKELDLLLKILPEGHDYTGLFDKLIRQAVNFGSFDLAVKLGHLAGYDKPFTLDNYNQLMSKGFDLKRARGSLSYLRYLITIRELENEFRAVVSSLAKSQDPIGEEILIEMISRYPKTARRNLSILQRAGIRLEVIRVIALTKGIKFF